MNLLLPFDYVFYRLSSFYKNNFGHEDYLYAISLLSIIQCTNIMVLISLFFILLNEPNELQPFIMLLLCVIILIILNSIRYNKKKYQLLNTIWGKEKRTIKIIRGFYILLYFGLSLILSALLVNLSIST
jgi:hypothetical protein